MRLNRGSRSQEALTGNPAFRRRAKTGAGIDADSRHNGRNILKCPDHGERAKSLHIAELPQARCRIEKTVMPLQHFHAGSFRHCFREIANQSSFAIARTPRRSSASPTDAKPICNPLRTFQFKAYSDNAPTSTPRPLAARGEFDITQPLAKPSHRLETGIGRL